LKFRFRELLHIFDLLNLVHLHGIDLLIEKMKFLRKGLNGEIKLVIEALKFLLIYLEPPIDYLVAL
jgi:hypothetical protein